MSSRRSGLDRRTAQSALASPWLWLVGQRPRRILAANVIAFLFTGLFFGALLGAYIRERDTVPTETTDLLENLEFYTALAALLLASICAFFASKTWARAVAALILVFAWPTLAVLSWITLQLKLA